MAQAVGTRIRETTHHPLYETLVGIVGGKYVKDDAHSLVPYSRDVGAHDTVKNGVIVIPKDKKQIAEIVKLANRTGIPITLKGGGQAANGVTRGVPTQNIVIDTSRLDQVFNVDIENQKVTYAAGVRPIELDHALRPYGYMVHTVLGPYYSVSMGGLLSGCSGGGYPKNMSSVGVNSRHVLGVEVVLPTGEILHTGLGPDSNKYNEATYLREVPGPDLTGLFIGQGGAFGIITEITQRIYKIPTVSKSFGFLFDNLDDMWDAQMRLSEDSPFLFTNMIAHDMPTMRRFGVTLEGNDFGMFLCVESDNEEDAALRVRRIEEVCLEKGRPADPSMDMYAAHGLTGSAMLVRDYSSEVTPFHSWEHLHPRAGAKEFILKLLNVYEQYEETNKKYKCGRVFYSLPIGNYMLLGITLKWDDSIPGAGKHVLGIWEEGAELLKHEGTSTTYCQSNNSNIIASAWTPVYYNTIKGLKKMLDPNNILCPGLWNL